MKTIHFYVVAIFCLTITACQSTDRTGNEQLDSAPVGNPDTLTRSDSLPNPTNITNESDVDGEGGAFIDSAALGGMMEVDLGKLAQEKGSSPSVKKFAAQMVKDHTKANLELKTIAEKLYVNVPEEYPAEVKSHMEAMKKMSGKEFDRHYMDMMVKDHVKTLTLFRNANSLRSELKDFAAKTLPVLEQHHKMATEIKAQLK